LDELTGNQEELYHLISKAMTSKVIKVLVSSRPIPACVGGFSHYPKLRLQDINRKDIHTYVKDTLGSFHLMKEREVDDPGLTTRLVEDISSKSAGVFLWVRLVVKRLISCLNDHDATEELENEIERLPSDFERLYQHLLDTVPEKHRPLGSRYLQMAVVSINSKWELNTLQLWFVENNVPLDGVGSPLRPIKPQQVQWRCKDMEGKLNSRCFGLLEVWKDPKCPASTPDRGRVEFLHRTVYEFLTLGPVWQSLVSLTADLSFEPRTAILDSLLADLKVIPEEYLKMPDTAPAPVDDRDGDHKYHVDGLSFRIHKVIDHQKKADRPTKKLFDRTYTPEFQRVIEHYWRSPALFGSPAEESRVINNVTARVTKSANLDPGDAFILWCVLRSPILDFHVVLDQHSLCGNIWNSLLLDTFINEQDHRIQKLIVRTRSRYISDLVDFRKFTTYLRKRLARPILMGRQSFGASGVEVVPVLDMSIILLKSIGRRAAALRDEGKGDLEVFADLLHASWRYCQPELGADRQAQPHASAILPRLRALDAVLGDEDQGEYEISLKRAAERQASFLGVHRSSKVVAVWEAATRAKTARGGAASTSDTGTALSQTETGVKHAPWRDVLAPPAS